MSEEIDGVDKGDLSAYAFGQMYLAMRRVEQYSDDYNFNNDILTNSTPGDKGIPRSADLDTIAGNAKFFMDRVKTYAEVFLAAEIADDSPRRAHYQAVIRAVDAKLRGNLIPRQRTNQQK